MVNRLLCWPEDCRLLAGGQVPQLQEDGAIYGPQGQAACLVEGEQEDLSRLAHCAQDVLAIPGMLYLLSAVILEYKLIAILLVYTSGSSVSIKRIFSGGRNLLSRWCNSLGLENMRMLMLYHAQLWMEERQK